MLGLTKNSIVPIVLVCEGECIAVPLRVLVKESTVFKSMFSSNWRGAKVNESSSAQEKSECKDTDVETETEKEVTNNETRTNTDSQNIFPQMVEIEGYKARAVTIFWDLIKGFNELLTACQDYTILADMLIFADFYDINRLNGAIAHQIDKVKVGKENLIQGMAAVENLEKLDRYKKIASTLEKRCIAFTESTFRAAKDVGLLVTKNSNNIDLVVRLLDMCFKMNAQEIKENKECFYCKKNIQVTCNALPLGTNVLCNICSNAQKIKENKECFHCKKNLQVKCNALPLGTNLLCNICSGYEYKKYCKCNNNRKCEASYCYTSTSVKSRCCNTSTCHTCQGHEARRYCQPH